MLMIILFNRRENQKSHLVVSCSKNCCFFLFKMGRFENQTNLWRFTMLKKNPFKNNKSIHRTHLRSLHHTGTPRVPYSHSVGKGIAVHLRFPSTIFFDANSVMSCWGFTSLKLLFFVIFVGPCEEPGRQWPLQAPTYLHNILSLSPVNISKWKAAIKRY